MEQHTEFAAPLCLDLREEAASPGVHSRVQHAGAAVPQRATVPHSHILVGTLHQRREVHEDDRTHLHGGIVRPLAATPRPVLTVIAGSRPFRRCTF